MIWNGYMIGVTVDDIKKCYNSNNKHMEDRMIQLMRLDRYWVKEFLKAKTFEDGLKIIKKTYPSLLHE